MGQTIGIIAIKGGVGKTTVAASLAADLVNHYGKKVLLVDANYSAPNLGLHMDIVSLNKTIHDVLDMKAHLKSSIQNKFGVDVVPGSYVCNKKLNYLKLKNKLSGVKDKYDFIIIDSSPSFNDEMLSVMVASDSLFVVTTPDYPTLSCSLKAAKIARGRGTPINGIIVNKIRDPFYELDLKEIEESVGIPVVAKIPDDETNVRALFTRIPTSIYNKNCKFGKEINRLGAALTGNKERRNIFRMMLPKEFRKEEVNRQILRESFYKSMFK